MPLKLHQRNKVWHYRGTVAGRLIRGSTRTEDRKIAQRIAAEVEARAWKGHLDGPEAGVTFAQAAIAYRAAEKPTRFLDRIEDHWKDTLLRKITTGAIRQSAINLYPDAKAATRNRQVIVPTHAIINHAADLGWCAPMKAKRFQEDRVEKRPATLEWVKAFAAQAEADGLPHLAALCLFMFGTGARRGEACSLTWGDVDFDERTAAINSTKTKMRRTAHLPREVVVALANVPSNRNPGDTVFGYASGESVGQVWGNVAERAGIEALTPHSCRHGFATTMLHNGIDVKTVAERGGWKEPATVLKHYAHAMTDRTVTDVLLAQNWHTTPIPTY